MEEALASLAAQGMGDDLEVIVQDADVEPDAGQSDAFNKGFAKAHGEWLFWLNADDVLLPGALAKVEGLINDAKKTEWIVGDTVYIDESGRVKEVRTDARWRPWFGRKITAWTGGPSAFFSCGLWGRLGGFDTSLKYVMDIDLWTRWARAGVKFEGLDSYVWGFRMHKGSKTMGGTNRAEHFREKEQILARYELSTEWVWRNVTRIASVFDGSWIKRRLYSRQFRNRHWSLIVK